MSDSTSLNVKRVTTLPDPPSRPADGHKGTFGRVAIVGGSPGMTGAACLAGIAALRGGAGLVSVAVPNGIGHIVAGMEPSYLTVLLDEDADGLISAAAGARLHELFANMSAAAIGPGLGRSDGLDGLVRQLFTDSELPLVVDADGLNALAADLDALDEHPAAKASRAPHADRPDSAARILTPHPGEFARLTGTSVEDVQADREQAAVGFAHRHRVVLVLKGPGTIVTDGKRIAVNETGNSGMATGGTGDVLTGLTVALLGRGMPAFDAARLAVHLHGLAGDLAAAELSEPGLIASDLPRYLGQAWTTVM